MRKFWLDCSFATFFVFAFLGGIYQISQFNIFSAFDPLGKALGDMQLTDIAFSRLREDPPIDTNIVIVNIGNLSRGGIGQQILNLSRCKPKVIGLDIIFSCDWSQDSTLCPQAFDTKENMIFGESVAGFKNMVMGEKLLQTDSLLNASGDIALYDSIEHSYPTLLRTAYEGFVSLETDAGHQEDLKSCRSFNPAMDVRGKQELAFSVRMAMLFDSVRTKKLLSREKYSEIINYKGNIVDWHGASAYPGRYPVLDWDQVLDTAQFMPGLIKDKIIIMGYLGADLRDTSWDDKFFTPLNKIYAGRSRPDMYGIVVHANIVSMILDQDYVGELQDWQEYAIAFMVIFLNMALFMVITSKLPDWWDGLSLLAQLIQVLLLSFIMVQFFSLFTFKLNLTVTLIGVGVAGTSFELYNSIVKKLFAYLGTLKWFTKRGVEVLNQ